MAEAGAVASLVELVKCAQADGQYAAAAALYNMASAHPELRPVLAAAGAVKALVALLKAESWCGAPCTSNPRILLAQIYGYLL